jgi:protein involved in polysaccharide export with SLBB domain
MIRCVTAGALALLSWTTLASEYRLGPADRVHVKVVEFNLDTLTPTEWSILTGDYTVDGAGNIIIPIVGSIPAAGLSVPDLNAAIEARVRKLIGFEEPAGPEATKDGAEMVLTASIEVVEYRPFFVAGNVKQPGAYPYRPNLTVLQAVSIAGGHPVPAEGGEWSIERDTINAQGTLRNLELDEASLLSRRARLQAELDGSAKIAFPVIADASGRSATEPGVLAKIRTNETAIFERRQAEVKRLVAALVEQKTLLENEVQSLQDQVGAQKIQATLIQTELKTISSLVDRGLTTTSRRLNLDRVVAEIESKILQLQTAIIQVRQDINRCERERSALLDKRQSEVAADLRDVQGSIDELAQKRATTIALLAKLQVAGSSMVSTQDSQLRTIYSIVRVGEDGRSTEQVDVPETASVEPGDTVKVTLEMQNRSAYLPSASATP